MTADPTNWKQEKMPTNKRSTLPFLLFAGMAFLVAGCAGPNLFDYLMNFGRNGICWAIVIILDVIALVEVFGSARGTGDKILWGLVIVFFPFLGCILYYIFARK
jgi:hypothetical protein